MMPPSLTSAESRHQGMNNRPRPRRPPVSDALVISAAQLGGSEVMVWEPGSVAVPVTVRGAPSVPRVNETGPIVHDVSVRVPIVVVHRSSMASHLALSKSVGDAEDKPNVTEATCDCRG